jgi:hypothetical protein
MPVLPPLSHLQRLAIGRAVLLCLRVGMQGEQWLYRYASAKVELVSTGGLVALSYVNLGAMNINVVRDVAYSRDPRDVTWCWPDDAVHGRLNGQPFQVGEVSKLAPCQVWQPIATAPMDRQIALRHAGGASLGIWNKFTGGWRDLSNMMLPEVTHWAEQIQTSAEGPGQ